MPLQTGESVMHLRAGRPSSAGIGKEPRRPMSANPSAKCFGVQYAPYNWGDTLDRTVHFHCELAMPRLRPMLLPNPALDTRLATTPWTT